MISYEKQCFLCMATGKNKFPWPILISPIQNLLMEIYLLNLKKHGMRKNYVMTAFALLLLAGCSNDVKESDIIFAEDSGARLVFSGVVTDQNQSPLTTTRVKDNMWEINDAIGITCGTNQVNIHYKYTGGEGSLFTAEGGDAAAIWVLGSNEYDVTAYYPFTGTSGSEPAPLNVQTTSEQQTDAERQNIDFLFAHEKVTRENPRVQLNFSHVMSRIKLKFEADEELTEGLSDIVCYLIGLKLEGTFNPNTGIATVKEDGKVDDIVWNVINDECGYQVEAIVFPQTVTSGVALQAGMRGYIYAVDFPTLTELKPGYSYNYTIKAKPYIDNTYRFEVTEATQINGWNDVNNDPLTPDPGLAGTDAETGTKDWTQEAETVTPTVKN